jgi:hypothetical protein
MLGTTSVLCARLLLARDPISGRLPMLSNRKALPNASNGVVRALRDARSVRYLTMAVTALVDPSGIYWQHALGVLEADCDNLV